MLSLHPQPGKLRYANNLLPTTAGGLASRPGATQIIAGDIAHAAEWGNRLLIEKLGRLRLWDGLTETDIAPAALGLQATPFQALTSGGVREERLYVADGVNPLWYVARVSGVYGRHGIANKVLDADGTAYPLPTAHVCTTWRGRLWTNADRPNRVQHCQFDDTEYWDPLWTPECQGEDAERVTALAANGTTLAVGLSQSVWQIAGDSQYNWRPDPVASHGVAGPRALASALISENDQRLYWASGFGLHQSGVDAPLSDALREAFASSPFPCEVAIDRRRRLLLLLVIGRLFVMHLDKPGQWGEITGHAVRGLLQMADYAGWYGSDGAWLLGARDMPDRRFDGTTSDFTSLYDTWEDIPNPAGSGRALLKRTQVVLNGSSRGVATYTVTADGRNTFTTIATLADETPELWQDAIAGLNGELWPTTPVRREFAPYLAGTKFRHQIAAPCHMEVLDFNPGYHFGEKE
jgi:hypothetical protein